MNQSDEPTVNSTAQYWASYLLLGLLLKAVICSGALPSGRVWLLPAPVATGRALGCHLLTILSHFIFQAIVFELYVPLFPQEFPGSGHYKECVQTASLYLHKISIKGSRVRKEKVVREPLRIFL